MQVFFYVTIIDLKLLLSFLIKKSLQWNFIWNVYKVNALFFKTNIPSHHTRHKILDCTWSHASSSWQERIVALALISSQNWLKGGGAGGGEYNLIFLHFTFGEEWQAITCVPQHVPKIILGALLSCTLDIKIARLVLIFKLQH